MARESDAVLYTRAGPEVGVAATKTHIAQITALEILALYLGEVRGTLSPADGHALLAAMGSLPPTTWPRFSSDSMTWPVSRDRTP